LADVRDHLRNVDVLEEALMAVAHPETSEETPAPREPCGEHEPGRDLAEDRAPAADRTRLLPRHPAADPVEQRGEDDCGLLAEERKREERQRREDRTRMNQPRAEGDEAEGGHHEILAPDDPPERLRGSGIEQQQRHRHGESSSGPGDAGEQEPGGGRDRDPRDEVRDVMEAAVGAEHGEVRGDREHEERPEPLEVADPSLVEVGLQPPESVGMVRGCPRDVVTGPVVVAEEPGVLERDARGEDEGRAGDDDDREVPAGRSWPLGLGHAAQVSTLSAAARFTLAPGRP
jgi:hypothetical protein